MVGCMFCTGAGEVLIYNRISFGAPFVLNSTRIKIAVAADVIGSAGFGSSMALTPDGSQAVIGGSFDNTRVGAVWPLFDAPPPPPPADVLLIA